MCSLGLFQTSSQRAASRQPFAEQIGISSSTRTVCLVVRCVVSCRVSAASSGAGPGVWPHVDWARQRTELHWHAAALRQGAQARWSLRHATSVGARAHVLGRPRVDATDLEIGDDVTVWSGHRRTLISGWGRIRVGHRVFVNSGAVVLSVEEVVLGDDVALANEVYVMDSDSHGLEGRPHVQAPVRIGSGTWVGARAVVLPGVTIGSRVMVGAGAVVTRDVPDDVLVAGNPARVVRPLTYPARCRRAWHDAWCPCPEVVPDEEDPLSA